MLTPEQLAEILSPSTREAPKRDAQRRGAGPALRIALVVSAGAALFAAGLAVMWSVSAPGTVADPVVEMTRPGVGPASAGATATASDGAVFVPMPLASRTPTPPPTPTPQDREPLAAPAALPAAAPRLIPQTVTATPLRGTPGTLFRFSFTGLPANAKYVAELIPPYGRFGRSWEGTVAPSGEVALSWLSPLDAPTGSWQVLLATTGRVFGSVSFQLAR